MIKIYGVVFVQVNSSLQSVFKGVPDYEKKSKDCYCLCIIISGVYLKLNPRLFIIEELIFFISMCQGITETNDEELYKFVSQIQNLIIEVGKHILYSLKTMDKADATATLE